MVKRRFLSTRVLQEGMVIDQSIMDYTGRVLVARKAVLDRYIIDALRKMGISGVYIREGEEDPEDVTAEVEETPKAREVIEKIKVPDRAKVNLSESVKKRVETGMQFLFSNPKDEGFVSETNHISEALMKAIDENDALAVDISALKVSDEYTFKHSVDVASIAMIIAKQLKLSSKEVYQIGIAGLLHDLGKSEVPPEILNKPGKLTDEEFEIMKKHSVYGYNLLKEKEDIPKSVLYGVLQHHEKINGRGYPLGVSGEKISPYAKILTVADIFDALVTERPYKKGFSPRDSVEMIMAMTGELDIDIIRTFINSVILYPVGSLVKLSNGETARVVENSVDYPTRPKVVGVRNGIIYNLAEDINCSNIIVE